MMKNYHYYNYKSKPVLNMLKLKLSAYDFPGEEGHLYLKLDIILVKKKKKKKSRN